MKVSGERRGAAFMLVDLKTGQSTLIGNVYEGIQASDVAPVRSMFESIR